MELSTSTLKTLYEAVDKGDLKRIKSILRSNQVYDCEYFAQYVEDITRFVYVDNPDNDTTLDAIRVFIGPLNNMVQMKVRKAKRSIDGMATMITLSDDSELTFHYKEDSTHDGEILHELPMDVNLLKIQTFLDD
jgi:hypothetical protein